MTYSHEEVNARLLDLVYGEAAPSERADLEAHVAGCARCRAELAALGRTRGFVRAALVEQPAPKGVHARLMQTATEAIAPVAAVAAAASPQRARAAAPAEAPTSAPSFWQRLRTGWTLPTFATVGAFAILLLASKVFLSPERTYERGHQSILPAEPAPAASARDDNAPAAATAAADEAAPLGGQNGPAGAAGPGARDDQDQKSELRRTGATARQRALGTALGKSMRHEADVDGLSGSLGRETGQEAFGSSEWPGAHHGGKVPGLGNIRGVAGSARGGGLGVVGAGAPKPVARAAEAAEGFAAPPSGWKGSAPAAEPASPALPPAPTRVAAKKSPADELDRPAPASSAKEVKEDRRAVEEADELEAAPARAKSEDKVAPSAPPPTEKRKAAPPRAAPSAAAQAPAKDTPATDSGDANERDAAPTQDALARRAEQLFGARRWDEAIAAYRELLRRYPAADPAAKWRARMAQAERASADSTASKAASKRTEKAASAPAEAR